MNHRPKLSSNATKPTITPSTPGPSHSYDLSVTDENNGIYLYNGSQQPTESLALIYDPSTSSFTLDKIDSEFRFNLRSTPTNDDASKLAAQYPQLDTGLQDAEETENGEDLFDENQNPDDEEPDPDNPYDYRHFLKSARAGHSPSPEPSVYGSPRPSHTFNTSPMLAASSPLRPSPAPKPTKRRSHPKPRLASPNPREEADADNEDSEADDVLTIDMGDSSTVANKPWRSALGVLNEGGRSSGPISLRSAASSMSPSLRGDSDNEVEKRSNADVEEIDLGDGGVEVESQSVGGEKVETPGVEEEEDVDDPFAAELEQRMIEEAMSEVEQEEHGGVMVNGSGGQVNGMDGVEMNRMIEESSEESEEE